MAPENTAPGLPADVPVGQPEHVVDLAFQVPDGWRAEPVDGWLRQVLDVAPGAAAVIEPGIDRTGEPASFLHRALAIALELMRVANVPVFQPARVLALHRAPAGEDTARPHRWSARIALPTVDLVSRRFSEAALSEAFGACARLARTPISPDTVGAFARRVQSSLVKPFAAAWTAGKSTLPLLRTVHARGVPFFHLGRGIYQIGLGARARRVDRSTIEFDSAIGARLSRDKGATAELLRLAGLPAPRHLIVRDVEHALKAAAALGWPVVVKPADRERGEGVQVDVDDAERLRAAFADAAALSATRRVIVERQVAGVCHRLFVARGRLLYAVARHPASVIGDGVSSVRELAEAHAAREALLPPWRRSGNAAFDTLARAAIAGAGFDESSVPAAGRRVPLRRIESTEWGGVDEDVTARVHPDNLRVALDAAALFGLEVAGIDVITTDIGLPWHRSGAIGCYPPGGVSPRNSAGPDSTSQQKRRNCTGQLRRLSTGPRGIDPVIRVQLS